VVFEAACPTVTLISVAMLFFVTVTNTSAKNYSTSIFVLQENHNFQPDQLQRLSNKYIEF